MMNKPDCKDYSLNEAALIKAKIDPFHCRGDVQCAITRELKGAYEAEGYLMQLMLAVEAGDIIPSRILPPPEGCLGDDEVRISKQALEQWQPKKLYPCKSNELSARSRSKFYQLIRGFVELVKQYEEDRENRAKPGLLKNKDIFTKADNRLSALALRELLQEVYPDTPERGEELIKEAMRETEQ